MEIGDREVKDGKPYLGLWFGKYVCVHMDEGPVYEEAEKMLKYSAISILPAECEIRHEQIIKRRGNSYDLFVPKATIGIKYMIHGRAWRVMKLTKIGCKRYKKCFVAGRRKWKRIDK